MTELDNSLVLTPTLESILSHPTLLPLVQQLIQFHQLPHVYDLTALGLALWDTVCTPIDSFPTSILISSNSVQVQNLPWEYLYHPVHGFLAKHPLCTLSRHLGEATPLFPGLPVPLSILLFTAQAVLPHRPALAVDYEQHIVRNTLAPWIAKGFVRLLAPDDGRFSSLQALLAFQTWSVVILSGHGGWTEASQGFFAFESEDLQGAMQVTANTLAELLSQAQVSCVVLAACQSGQFVQNSLAVRMLQAGIPFVVGMRESLLDRAGSVFVKAFCTALAQYQRIDIAVQQGRCAMTHLLATDEVWDDEHLSHTQHLSTMQWSLPILFRNTLLTNLTKSVSSFPPCTAWEQPSVYPLPSRWFIGRRQELRDLTQKLRQGKVKYIWITGRGGIGKTALVEQWLLSLAEYGYHPFDANNLFCKTGQIDVIPLKSEKSLLWLDNPQVIQNFLSSIIQLQIQLPHVHILITTRDLCLPQLSFYHYPLFPPTFDDFCRYTQHLGLLLDGKQMRLTYEVLEGNFRGVQLLQGLLVNTDRSDFTRLLSIAKRYLRAYVT